MGDLWFFKALNNLFNLEFLISIMNNIDNIVSKEIKNNFFKVSNSLRGFRENLPSAIKEYIERASRIKGVMGIYFGLNGLEINILNIIESKDLLVFCHPAQDLILNIELEITKKYALENIDIDHRTMGSAGRTLDELESGGDIFGFFKDDKLSGLYF